jgi:hypothetical protein
MVEYSGRTSSYEHKHGFDPSIPSTEINQGVKKVWMLDAQWSTCPVEVENEVKELWRYWELGNDDYMARRSINDLLEMKENGFTVERWYWGEKREEQLGWVKEPGSVDIIIQYLREQGVPDDEDVIIHWWW